MSGAGNDFVVIDNRSGRVTDGPALARKLCDRRWGVGADGLLLLETSQAAEYRMMYYNADGSYGGMCGNGGRCIARYAALSGIAKNHQIFEALSNRYECIVDSENVKLSMLDPKALRMNLVLRMGSVGIKAHYVDTGSPHVVIPAKQLYKSYKTLEGIPVEDLGRKIRRSRLFMPEGTNVNFIERIGPKSIRMRTYERGVEAETLACGTGSVASAIIGSLIWKMGSPVRVIPSSEVELRVGFNKTGHRFSRVTLYGPAVVSFEGKVRVDG
jgi:diaminopimelate epimerase